MNRVKERKHLTAERSLLDSLAHSALAMSSLPLLLEQLASAQRAVVEALSSEYFCEDLEPPSCAFGWGEEALRDYFETGGESAPPKAAPAAPAADARPVIVCLGDSLTEFGSHVVGPKFADATLKNTPLASEVLRATDGNEEHGPGWVALLARDYQWRTTADVLNRGFSGMTSRLLRADLASIVASLPSAPVAAVVVTLGANDAAEGGVPRDEFRQNLDAICGALKELLPSAAVLLATPPPINHQARLPLPPAKAGRPPRLTAVHTRRCGRRRPAERDSAAAVRSSGSSRMPRRCARRPRARACAASTCRLTSPRG